MSSSLQLSVPDGAQIHIHLGAPLQLAGTTAPAEPRGLVPAEAPKRRPLRLAVAAMVLFGSGYGLRSLSAPPANAQNQVATSLAPVPFPTLPDSPASVVLGSAPGLPSSIHVNPLPLPPGMLASQVPGQYPGQVPGGYPSPLPRPQPGMAVRAPYPALPAAPTAPGTATATTPSTPRNPFGLE